MTETPDAIRIPEEGIVIPVTPIGDKHLIIKEWASELTPRSDGLPDGVTAIMHMKIIDDVPQCVELTFRSDHGLSAKAVREFRMEHHIERACVAVALQYDPKKASEGGSAWSVENPLPMSDVRKARAKTRGGYTDEMLREVAEIYEANQGHHPTKAVREAFDVRPSTAQLYVKRARERGFLAPFSPDKAGNQ